MKTVTREAYAKINPGLDVIDRREDGYHLVKMLMQTISLHDTVSLEATEDGSVSMTIRMPEQEVCKTDLMEDQNASAEKCPISDRKSVEPKDALRTDDSNLCIRAARLLQTSLDLKQGVKIHLIKRIPIAAGLAGGSTDAAAVLCGMNTLFDLHLSEKQLMAYGLKLGADVPYCVKGGTSLSEGIGEVLTPIEPAMPKLPLIIAKPEAAVSTKAVYQALDSLANPPHPDIDAIIDGIRRQDVQDICKNLGNILESVTAPHHPEITAIEEYLLKHGAIGAQMSGSGPTVFGIFEDPAVRDHCLEGLHAEHLARSLFAAEIL